MPSILGSTCVWNQIPNLKAFNQRSYWNKKSVHASTKSTTQSRSIFVLKLWNQASSRQSSIKLPSSQSRSIRTDAMASPGPTVAFKTAIKIASRSDHTNLDVLMTVHSPGGVVTKHPSLSRYSRSNHKLDVPTPRIPRSLLRSLQRSPDRVDPEWISHFYSLLNVRSMSFCWFFGSVVLWVWSLLVLLVIVGWFWFFFVDAGFNWCGARGGFRGWVALKNFGRFGGESCCWAGEALSLLLYLFDCVFIRLNFHLVNWK